VSSRGDKTADDSSRGPGPPRSGEPPPKDRETSKDGEPRRDRETPKKGVPPRSSGPPEGSDPPLTGDTVKVSKVVRRSPPPLEPGFILDGRYEIEACIGEGGSGFVFSALDRSLGLRIALKTLRGDRASDMSWIKRMRREVKVAREIEHPNVLRVFDFNSGDGYWFITMDLALGGSLREVLDKRSGIVRARDFSSDPLLPAKFDDARAVCAGLSAIHAVGIVHRDVTPGNVLRMADGRLVITDFGLAVRPEDTTTFHGGTPRYMAPEVIAKQPADQRSDVWQLGILLHEIIFGRYPRWEHEGDRVSLKLPADDDSEPVERELAQLCAECLSHNPEARPPNAIAVAGRLTTAERAKPLGPVARTWRRAKQVARRPLVWGTVFALALVFPAIRVSRALFRPSVCDRALAQADAVWTARQEDLVQTRFLTFLKQRPGADQTFRSLTGTLKQHLAEWRTAYRSACVASNRSESTPAISCLEEDLDGVRGVVSLFYDGAGAENLIDEAPYAIASLRGVARCKSASNTNTTPRPPPGPLRDEVDDLRRKLMFANPLMEGEHFASPANVIEPVVAAATRTGYCPVIAEALLAEAHAIGRRPDVPAGYRSRLEDALLQAESCGHDRIVAIAAAELAYADRFKVDTNAPNWARIAESVLGRMGGDVSIQSWLENSRAIAASSRGRYDDAVKGYQKALALKRSEVGPDHLEYAIRLVNLSDALKGAGRFEEALATSDQAITLMLRWLGPDHIDVAMVKNNRADLLVAVNRLKEAETLYSEALAIFRARVPEGDFHFLYPLGGMGMALLKEGNSQDARAPLEKALAVNVGDDRYFASQVRFALARALFEDATERERAVGLARAAKETLPEAVEFEKDRREIADWLASHERAPSPALRPVKKNARQPTGP
jgi:serine/threonine protein kinase/tetratricopeptide (TPR) repeat protein